MSWREFMVLVRGLGPWSVTVTRADAERRAPRDTALKDPKAVEAAFAKLR